MSEKIDPGPWIPLSLRHITASSPSSGSKKEMLTSSATLAALREAYFKTNLITTH